MNHTGCKAIGLLAFWGGIGGAIYPPQLAQAQTTGVRYGNYIGITAAEPLQNQHSTLEPTLGSAAEKQKVI